MRTFKVCTLALLGAALVGLPGRSRAQGYDQNGWEHRERHFFMEAAEGSTNEVALSRLAVRQAQDPRVREFARRMIRDHEDLNSRLRGLADRKGVDITEAVHRGWHDDVENLSRLSGTDFDRQYLEAMIRGHRDAIDLFERAAQSHDPDIAALASDALPTIREHLHHARVLAGREREEGAPNYPPAPPPPQ